MALTIKQTIAAIRALGIRATWSSEWQEFRVFYPDAKPGEGAFLDDREDALATAQHMADNKAIFNR